MTKIDLTPLSPPAAGNDEPEAREAIKWATAQIPMGREPLTGTGLEKPVDFEAIRLRLLRSAAGMVPDGEK